MTHGFLGTAMQAAQLIIGLAMVCAFVRMAIGPRAQDRVLALDTLYVQAMLLVLTRGVWTGSPHVFESALVIAVLGFVSTAAASKFLLRGEVIE